jgi:hypothetical protein
MSDKLELLVVLMLKLLLRIQGSKGYFIINGFLGRKCFRLINNKPVFFPGPFNALLAGLHFKDNHDPVKSNRHFTFGKTSLSL